MKKPSDPSGDLGRKDFYGARQLERLLGPRFEQQLQGSQTQMATSDPGTVFELLRKTEYGAGIPDLVLAAQVGHSVMVQQLLANGADPDTKSSDGRTALMEAIAGRHTDVAELLLAAGCDVTTEASDGWTALMIAAGSAGESIVRLLLDRGADPNSRTTDGSTPLIRAAERGRKNLVKLLLDHGADANVKDNIGSTALTYAASGGETESGGNSECVTLLLKAGADPSNGAYEGQTALMLAAFYNDVDSVRALIEGGAKVNARDANGATALHIARTVGAAKVIPILAEAGAEE